MRKSILAAALATAYGASATEGSHVNESELRSMLEEAVPAVQVVEVEKIVEKEVRVEVPVEVEAEQSISFGGSLDAQGCATSAGVESTYTSHVGYTYEHGAFSFRGNVVDKPRGSDCTEQGLSIDLAGTQTFDNFIGGAFLDLDIGYDEHGVTGFDHNGAQVFGGVKQTTAAIMLGDEIAGFRLKAGWNLANSEPRVGVAYAWRNIEVGFDCTGTDGADPYCDAKASWQRGFGDGWGVLVEFDHSNGLEYLLDPFGGRADEPAANEVNSLRVSFTKAL